MFDFVFGNNKKKKQAESYREFFKMMNAYNPVFTSHDGGLYEMELMRSAIHAFANAASKLKPEFTGSAYKSLGKRFQYKANRYMDTSKFLYRLATILSVNTTAFIIPIYGEDYETIVGYYPLLPQQTEVIDVDGVAWLRYTFIDGKRTAMELERVGVLTQYQYRNEIFGDGNNVLNPTMSLINTHSQGMENAVKQSAAIRFIGRLASHLSDDDEKEIRNKFFDSNLSSSNDTGFMMINHNISDIKQIDSKPYVIDKEQMELIRDNVYSYFGVSEAIVQNKFDENVWNAFYEGKIEPFALQLGLVMTNMTFTQNEIDHGNSIMFTSNRLQYASNQTKLLVTTKLFDRGAMTLNDFREVWNMKPIAGGDKTFIRKEYAKEGDDEYYDFKNETNNRT